SWSPRTRQIAAEPGSAGFGAVVSAVALWPVATVDRPCTRRSGGSRPSRSASADKCAGGRSMRRPTRRADSLLARATGAMIHRSGTGLRREPQPEGDPVALPGGSAEIVLLGALEELPRGGLASCSPLAR